MWVVNYLAIGATREDLALIGMILYTLKEVGLRHAIVPHIPLHISYTQTHTPKSVSNLIFKKSDLTKNVI